MKGGAATARPSLIGPALATALIAFGGAAGARSVPGADPPARTLSQLQWNQDGTALVGLADEESRNAALQAYDGTTGRPAWRLPLDRLRDPARGKRLKLDRWQPSTETGELLIESEGDLFLATSSGAALRRLTSSRAPEEGALLSPDGGRVAFRRDGDLWAIELVSGSEIRLTRDGKPPALVNGASAESGEPEILSGGAGFAWAPESRTIAYLRREQGALRLRLVSVLTQDSFEVETGTPDAGTLAEVEWRFDARALGVERLSADGSRLDLLLCHPEKLYCRQLAKRPLRHGEVARRDFRFLASGFVWGSGVGARAELALYDTLGRERRSLAFGDWVSDEIEGVDLETETVLISGSKPAAGGSPERGLFSLPTSSPGAPLLHASATLLELAVAPTGTSFVVTQAAPGGARRRELRSLEGKAIAELPPPAGK